MMLIQNKILFSEYIIYICPKNTTQMFFNNTYSTILTHETGAMRTVEMEYGMHGLLLE